MLNINEFGATNKTSSRSGGIKYVIMHYTAGTQSKVGSAKSVCSMWNTSSTQASADYVVDDGSIWHYPKSDNRYTWAVGGSKYATKGGAMYGIIKNNNSVSVEMCSSNTTHKITSPNDNYFYFTDAVIENSIQLAAYLLKKYNLGIDKLYRHYDVTGKLCPGIKGWNTDSGSEAKWKEFKLRVVAAMNGVKTTTTTTTTTKKEDELDMTISEFVNKIDNAQSATVVNKYRANLNADNTASSWAKENWDKATQKGIVDGSRPHDILTREEFITVIGRLGLL